MILNHKQIKFIKKSLYQKETGVIQPLLLKIFQTITYRKTFKNRCVINVAILYTKTITYFTFAGIYL